MIHENKQNNTMVCNRIKLLTKKLDLNDPQSFALAGFLFVCLRFRAGSGALALQTARSLVTVTEQVLKKNFLRRQSNFRTKFYCLPATGM